MYQGLTIVRRDERGNGIAMALKPRTVEWARDHGIREIRTWNDTLNRSMLRNQRGDGLRKAARVDPVHQGAPPRP